MAVRGDIKRKSPRLRFEDGRAVGFVVTREIEVGTVEFGAGDEHPHEAAFRLIGRDGSDGLYRFPTEDGGVCEVTVEHKPAFEKTEA